MKGIFINNALFRIICPPFYGTVVYLLILLINNSIYMLNETFFTEEVYISIGLTFLIFEANRLAIIIIEKAYRKQENLSPQIITQLGVNTLITVLITSIALSIYFIFVLGFSNYNTELTYFNIIFIVTSWMYNMIYFSHIYLHKQNKEILDIESTLRESIEREFLSFKNDVNPELLYESLESLITLVHIDPVEAEDFIDRLSLAYRYILSNKQNEFVDLEEDLSACQNLIYLLNIKNNNNIKFDIQIPSEAMSRQVIPGTIPGVIEYIVRKSIINKNQQLAIKCLVEEDGYLAFQYKVNDRLSIDGLNNVIIERLQEAYSYFSDKPVVKVEAYGDCYIKIPALELSTEELAI